MRSTSTPPSRSLLQLKEPEDRLVVGVDDPHQLTAWAAASAVPAETVAEFVRRVAPARALVEGDPDVADPRTWHATSGGGGVGGAGR